jgi:hypothetical protein
MSKIKSSLISAILPAAEALVPLMETLSHIMSGVAVVIKGIGFLFKVIGGIVEGMLAPFSFLNDLISNGLTNATSNFSNQFLSSWQGITKLIVGTVAGLMFGWKGLFSFIKKGAIAAGTSLKSVFNVDAYKGFFTGMTDKLKDLFSKKGGSPLPTTGGGGGISRKPTPSPTPGGSKGASMLGNLGASVRALPAKKLLMLGAAFTVFSAGVFVLAKALQQFGSVDWGAMGKAGVALLALTGVVFGLGALISSGVGAVLFGAGVLGLIALGAAFVVLGAGMNVIGKAAQKFATAISMISEIDASVIKEVTGVIPDFLSSFEGVEDISQPLDVLANSMDRLVGSLLKLQDVSYENINKGLQSLASTKLADMDINSVPTSKLSPTEYKKEPSVRDYATMAVSKVLPKVDFSKNNSDADENTSDFKQRNNALAENATSMNMTRLIQLMEQSIGNPPNLVVEFDDGTVSKLKTRIKKTV